ncbi:hypothetical protein [Desmospora activa]|uniref:Uncharacterized protein n=1 Tax=Desmospora activa DSM 45169 TaxID=1121389 RepID=A0A2T4Z9Z9_9BACL|nr:hypothetical protein [Desmospora activa]PTM58726.1 hypothetical protein C8J48_1314 [Desmospora activa DSM 45169]
MKKKIAVILLSLLLLWVTGCGLQSDDESSTNPEATDLKPTAMTKLATTPKIARLATSDEEAAVSIDLCGLLTSDEVVQFNSKKPGKRL